MTDVSQPTIAQTGCFARRALRALAILMLGLLCLDAQAVDDLPWAAIKGVSAVSDYTPDGVPVDFVFAPTENILDGGQIWYRAVKHFGNAHKQDWDAQGWRQIPIPGGMRTSYRLASAWVHKPGAEMHMRKVWIAAIDSEGNYRLASYNPWHNSIGNGWGGWYQMGKPPGGPQFNGPPSIVSYGNYVRLFATSNDKLWMRTYNGVTEQWSEWSQESGMTLRAGTGLAVSPMYMNFASDEKAVLVVVREDGKLMWRVYGHVPDNFWREVPGSGLTNLTPALARSSSTRLNLIVMSSTGPSLRYQTLTDGALWQGWKLLATDPRFDQTPAYLHGGGGPSASYLPPSNVVGTGPGRDVPLGALHVHVDGAGDFQRVYAARLLQLNQGPDQDLHPNNGCVANCNGLPVWQEIPGTAVPTLTLLPIPTMPRQIPSPHYPMVASDGPEQMRPCAPLSASVRVARHPYYGTDFLMGSASCGGQTRLYWRSGSNLGRGNALWDSRGWAELPGIDAYQGHDIATVGNEFWVTAVGIDGSIRLTRITGFNSANQLNWESPQDISANLACGQGQCQIVVKGPPGIVAANGFVWIWVRDANGSLWRRKYDREAGAWQGGWAKDEVGFKVAPFQTVAGTEIVQGGKRRTLLVAVQAVSGNVYYKVPEVSEGWTAVPGNGKSDGSPAVARGADNKVHVVVRGSGGSAYWYQTLTDGTTWRTAWSQLPGGGVFYTGNSRGPAAVFRSGGYLDPAAPSAASWDATPALHVYGGAGAAGTSIWGTSFVANGSALQLREQGWMPVPSTAPVPLPPTAPKPPVTEGPDGTYIPPPPQPGTPEWNAPFVSEPVNQWYPFCLSWSLYDGYQWWDEWRKTLYYPGENFTDADDLGLEIANAASRELHPDGLVWPGEHDYKSWAAGACQ